MGDALRIVALDGDETGQELLEQALRVLDPGLLGLDVAVEHFDLSLENRRATANEACTQAAARMRETVAAGTRTPDLGGHAGTTEFTDAVIALLERKLDAGPPREGSS